MRLAAPAIALDRPLKIGLMLPFSGADAAQGEAIATGFDLHVRELDRKMGGRTVEIVRADDGSDPAKALSNINWLLGHGRAEVLIGTVHRDIVLALIDAARTQQIPLIVPGAGAVAATRELCAPPVFRSSFSNWQPGYGMGKSLAAQGARKVALATWDYPTGKEAGEGFRDGLRAGGAELVEISRTPYPETNFRPLLRRLSELRIDAAGAFFTGAGAIEFVKAYAEAGLHGKLPLCGSGFLTEGLLTAQGAAAEGIQTALHYCDALDNAKNVAFRAAYKSFASREADVYGVQGYDAAQMLAIGLAAAAGDTTAIGDFAAAIAAAKIDSARGAFTVSAAHNPVQTIWLREVRNGENRVIGVAAEALADPGTGCRLA